MSETKRIELKIPADVFKKFEEAAAELNHIQKIMTYEPRMLISQSLEVSDYEDIINDSLVYVDKYLNEQREKLKAAKKMVRNNAGEKTT